MSKWMRMIDVVSKVGHWGVHEGPDALARGTAKLLKMVVAAAVLGCGFGSSYTVWYVGRWLASQPGVPHDAFSRFGYPPWFGTAIHWVFIVFAGVFVGSIVRETLSGMWPGVLGDQAGNSRGGDSRGSE